MSITLHPSLSREDVAAAFKEFELSLGSHVQLLNSQDNTDAILNWLDKNSQHPDGKGVYPTAQSLKRGAAELHRAGKLQYVAGHSPRTQEEIRQQQESEKYPEMLSQADVNRQTQDAAKAATIMALLKRRTETAGADIRSHYTKQRIREGLAKFFKEFLADNPVEKLTAAQAIAFEIAFNKEEIRLFGSK